MKEIFHLTAPQNLYVQKIKREHKKFRNLKKNIFIALVLNNIPYNFTNKCNSSMTRDLKNISEY